MPFGLKNAGTTYQRMMTKMFKPQLGKNIEVYIDDMVVKSKVMSDHVGDLGNIFEILRRHKLCLNASKYSFGVSLGKFLGYIVTHRGIEVNPDQIRAIKNLQPLQNPKEVGVCLGLPTAEGIPFLATYYVPAREIGSLVCLCCCSLSYGKLSIDTS